MLASNIPAKFPIPFANSAGAGYIRTIPVSSQIGITNGAASLTDGFVPLNFLPVGSGGVPPFGQDFNGLLNEITSWNRWAQAGGQVGYDSAFSTAIGGYPKGAIIAAATAGNFWLCTVDNNTSDPDTAGAGWTGFQLLTPAIIASITPAESSLWYIGTASAGTSTAITTTLMPSPVTSSSIRAMRVPITTTNGPSATLNFGFSPVPIVINTTGAAVTGGEMPGGIGFEADFEYDGTYARLMNPVGQLILTGAATYYVNALTGSDSNNGLTSGTAFATLQHAISITLKYNLNGYSITIEVANGTYAGPLTLPPINGSGTVSFVGNPSTPSNVIISASAGSAVLCEGVGYFFNGFRLESGGASGGDIGAGVIASANGTCYLENVWFGPCYGAWAHAGGGEIYIGGNVIVSGNISGPIPGCGFNAQFGGTIQYWVGNEPNLTISGLLTIANAFIQAYFTASTFLIFTSIAYPTNVTSGSRYNASNLGIIDTNGGGSSYYPGSTAGTTSGGGQYV